MPGTSGADTFTADNTATTKVLSVADSITGGAGTDTLRVFIATADTTTGISSSNLTSIENVYINGGAVVAFTAPTGTTSVEMDSTVANTAATFTLSGQTLTLSNHTAGAGTTTTVASTTDTSQSITLNKIAGATHTLALTGTLVTSATLTSTGGPNVVTLTNAGAALATLNIAGTTALTLTESLASVKTINGSTATGALLVDVSGATMNSAFAFTGGSGNDRLTFAAAQTTVTTGLASGATIDFGAGTDTLVIKDTTPVYATINAMKGLEILGVGVTAATVNMASLTASTVQTIGAIAASTVTNLESTDTVIIGGAMGTSMTMSGVLGNSVGNLVIGEATNTAAGIAGTGGMTIASLVVTGLTNMNINSVGTNAAANIITAMTNDSNSGFTITGNNDLTMTVTAATALGVRVNGAAFTGKLTAVGSNVADVLIGGSGADRLTGGLIADTLTGGAGADTFVLTTGGGASLYVGSLATTASMDRITDFVAGTDKIALINGTTPITGVTITAVTVATAADVAALLTAIGTQVAVSAGAASQVGVITVSAGAMGRYLCVD
jgi:hypothetical protein